MNPWRESLLAFSALPEVGALLLAAEPAWIWSRDGSRILWANPAGARRLGAASFAVLGARRWQGDHPLRRSIESLGRAFPGKESLARLRLGDDASGLPVSCRCRLVRESGERGTLVVAIEEKGERPGAASLIPYLSDAETGAVILDATGGVLAEHIPGLAAAITPATPRFALIDSGRFMRVFLLPQGPKPAAARPADAAKDVSTAIGREPGIAEPEAEPPQFGPAMASAEPARGIETQPQPAPAVKIGPMPTLGPVLAAPARRESQASAGEEPRERSVSAGRVERRLSRKAVRFLWQTDAAGRVLFVSPGLPQVVGRNSEIVGERWQDASARLRLDPTGRIAQALGNRDTWSGLTAWWPVEGSNVRVPAELTALPVFGGDQSFQGFRGFGVLKPAEALMPAAFEARFGAADEQHRLPEPTPPYEESVAPNVVPIRVDLDRMTDHAHLTVQERNAFEEIAAALKDRVTGALRPAAERESAPAPGADAAKAEDAEAESVDPPPPIAEEDAVPSEASAPAPELRVAPETPRAPAFSERAEARLRARLSESERRLHEMATILDTATDGVLTLDAEGTIESVNASAEALFGLDAQEMLGVPFGDLLTPESRTLALDYLSGLRDSGVASLLNEGRELEAKAGAGTIPLFMTMGRLSGDRGGRFCAVLRDITHWKRTEADLVAAKRAAEAASNQKSEFLARVSHEVRTPLNAIIGFAEVMIEERFGPVENERYREYLRDVRTSGEHVVSLVNDLLDISKIEAGKLDLDFTAVPLNETVRESIALMQPQANRARVVLRSSLSQDVPAIVADQRTLRQIVLNLLSNSVKFTAPGGQVIASTRLSESGEALLRIRDTGEGMSEDELARALEPFRQLSTASIADLKGTGLGLPLTKALVEANRARLTIRSARGEGTVVTVTFPPTRVLSE